MMQTNGIQYRREANPIKAIEGWAMPDPPEGFSTPVAFYYEDGEVVLDWTRERVGGDFASEHPELDGQSVITWPFRDGELPNVEDWTDIGITPLW